MRKRSEVSENAFKVLRFTWATRSLNTYKRGRVGETMRTLSSGGRRGSAKEFCLSCRKKGEYPMLFALVLCLRGNTVFSMVF